MFSKFRLSEYILAQIIQLKIEQFFAMISINTPGDHILMQNGKIGEKRCNLENNWIFRQFPGELNVFRENFFCSKALQVCNFDT